MTDQPSEPGPAPDPVPPAGYRTYPADYFRRPDADTGVPSGPGPGRATLPTARVLIALTVLVGQLWALTVAANAWLTGDLGTAWWTTAFSAVCFLVVALIWRLTPEHEH
ncbi:hypothetical protein ABH930_004786 [Kitasatospora sp. GAS204A]|uniref:DUF6755 family protein n=1 Tax=unclassified Kitasatospora TaxID=2633591 RepID=UPI0024739B16|nr:DUF6755 family protein [Kitasatospora sp. GAS204B]MDH6120690.1 hypothetical protein [Kitasatospora sp. GAS204B]